VLVRFIWKDPRNPGNAERGAALFPRSPFRGEDTGTAKAARAAVPPLRPPSVSAAARPRRLQLPARLRFGRGPGWGQIFNLIKTMLTLNLTMPEAVFSEFSEAADKLNQRFGHPKDAISPKTLMAFALARYDADDLCSQFDLALRIARAEREILPNPVLN
jgi:hypothetical protein